MSLNPSAMDRRLDPLRERTSTTFSSAWTELLMEFPSSADDNNPDPRRVKQSGMFVFGAPRRSALPRRPSRRKQHGSAISRTRGAKCLP
jgi:hypothetical protein